MKNDTIYILQKVTGVSGQPGADAQLDVEGIRTEDGFVTEGHIVQENRARRKDALNVQTGVVVKVLYI